VAGLEARREVLLGGLAVFVAAAVLTPADAVGVGEHAVRGHRVVAVLERLLGRLDRLLVRVVAVVLELGRRDAQRGRGQPLRLAGHAPVDDVPAAQRDRDDQDRDGQRRRAALLPAAVARGQLRDLADARLALFG